MSGVLDNEWHRTSDIAVLVEQKLNLIIYEQHSHILHKSAWKTPETREHKDRRKPWNTSWSESVENALFVARVWRTTICRFYYSHGINFF